MLHACNITISNDSIHDEIDWLNFNVRFKVNIHYITKSLHQCVQVVNVVDLKLVPTLTHFSGGCIIEMGGNNFDDGSLLE